MISIQHARRLALALFFSAAAACGGEDGDDGPPDNDANPVDPGPGSDGGETPIDPMGNDAAVPGSDSAVPGSDATTPDGDGGLPEPDATVGGPPDGGASDEELQMALAFEGVRADMRRAELVLPAFCRMGAVCGFGAGVTEASCLSTVWDDWTQSIMDGDSVECQDALLDFWSCGAALPCGAPECRTYFERGEMLCTVAE